MIARKSTLMHYPAPHDIDVTPDWPQGWRVDRIIDLEGLRALEAPWNDLVRRARIDHPFCSYEWMHAWWRAFGRGRTLSIFAVRTGGELAAIAPLMLTRGRLCGLPVTKLESIGNDHTPRFEMIVDPRFEGAYDLLWQSLAGDESRWDVLQVSQLPEGSDTLSQLTRRAADAHWPIGTWTGEQSPYVTFDHADDGFPETARRKHRTNVRRQLRRLDEIGGAALEILDGQAALDDALTEGFRLEAVAWKVAEGTAIVSQPEVETFYRRLAHECAAAGTLRLVFLCAANRRIAFGLGLRHGDSFHMLKCGYDPAFARVAPVHLLCHLLFKRAPAVGLHRFEFLGDREEWKLKWTDRTRRHVWLYVFRNAWWARLVHRAKFGLLSQIARQPAAAAVRAALAGQTERSA